MAAYFTPPRRSSNPTTPGDSPPVCGSRNSEAAPEGAKARVADSPKAGSRVTAFMCEPPSAVPAPSWSNCSVWYPISMLIFSRRPSYSTPFISTSANDSAAGQGLPRGQPPRWHMRVQGTLQPAARGKDEARAGAALLGTSCVVRAVWIGTPHLPRTRGVRPSIELLGIQSWATPKHAGQSVARHSTRTRDSAGAPQPGPSVPSCNPARAQHSPSRRHRLPTGTGGSVHRRLFLAWVPGARPIKLQPQR